MKLGFIGGASPEQIARRARKGSAADCFGSLPATAAKGAAQVSTQGVELRRQADEQHSGRSDAP